MNWKLRWQIGSSIPLGSPCLQSARLGCQRLVILRIVAIQQFKLNIGILKATCEQLGLSVAALQAGQLRDSIDPTIEIIASDSAERMCGMLSVTIENELSLRKFFAIPDEKAKVYGDGTEPLGSDVAASFPSSTFDASEAKRCFALSRNTACVFHLMRVLEIGLSAFAVKFNVSASHTNWETIINQIERAIKEPEQDQNRSPTWKDDREFYSQCASHFRIVKDAWRNYTAHARGKYDEQEASDMLTSVRGFMQKLATRLHE